MLIVWSLVLLTILGVGFALGLSFASVKFRVDADPRIDEVVELLPGANCGGCGLAGCAATAERIAKGEAPFNICPALDMEAGKRVADIIGVEYVEREREIAVVRCNGKDVEPRFLYDGVRDCRAAMLVQGGPHGCGYGCLGFGTCVEACRFDALRMGWDDLPKVSPERCTGCGKCVEACPRDLILLVPISKTIHVLCRSRCKGAIVKKICSQGCIGCKKCEKECAFDAVHVSDFLAEIDYEKCTVCGKCVEVCPTDTIVVLSEKGEAETKEGEPTDAVKEEAAAAT